MHLQTTAMRSICLKPVHIRSAEQASKLSVLQSLFETVRQASDARADELTDRLTSEYNILFEKLTATESTLGSKVAEVASTPRPPSTTLRVLCPLPPHLFKNLHS